jgi:hypothetical protein
MKISGKNSYHIRAKLEVLEYSTGWDPFGLSVLCNLSFIRIGNFSFSSLLINKQTPWPLVHKQTIQTERPPLVGES